MEVLPRLLRYGALFFPFFFFFQVFGSAPQPRRKGALFPKPSPAVAVACRHGKSIFFLESLLAQGRSISPAKLIFTSTSFLFFLLSFSHLSSSDAKTPSLFSLLFFLLFFTHLSSSDAKTTGLQENRNKQDIQKHTQKQIRHRRVKRNDSTISQQLSVSPTSIDPHVHTQKKTETCVLGRWR